MRKIPLKSKYGWNYTLPLKCRVEDVNKFKKEFYLPWKKKYNCRMSFNAFMSCVIFPEVLKARKERLQELYELAKMNKKIKDFV
jgi:hypothetical protein